MLVKGATDVPNPGWKKFSIAYRDTQDFPSID